MVKTRHQLNAGLNETVFKSLSSIVREGGFFRLYRGMSAEILGMIPKSSAMYGSYEIARRQMNVWFPSPNEETVGHEALVSFGAGLFSGIPESTVVTPFQVVKVRLQTKEYTGQYKNTLDCFLKVFRQEGIATFATGYVPTLWRNCVWNSIYFGTMAWLKSVSPKVDTFLKPTYYKTIEEKERLLYSLEKVQTLVTGFCGAIFATCFNAPFDVVKSRFQSQMHLTNSDGTKVPLKYRGTFQTLFLIYKEEGIAACYKGFKPKAIRMGLGGGVAMMTFEISNKFLS